MNPSEGVREIEKEAIEYTQDIVNDLISEGREVTFSEERSIRLALIQALTQAEKRGFERAREEALNIANMIPLDENFIPAGNYSANGMNGLVRVIRKGIVENIRNLTYEEKV